MRKLLLVMLVALAICLMTSTLASAQESWTVVYPNYSAPAYVTPAPVYGPVLVPVYRPQPVWVEIPERWTQVWEYHECPFPHWHQGWQVHPAHYHLEYR